ncbi:hypothetical protein EW026_g114 [Hermanssonia centrifuga]|uniref:GATA-type domain-containing protein n=1 Tax=Hermanssonia centrifuga TaxID=98765 RepID=A0A4S4L088_9APHY|nr:hypothetical protein EW026_g114 [Hermanssonia centrifuga]
MSFLAPSQRGYDPLAHPDLSQLPRASMNTPSAFDNLSSSPMPSVLHGSMPHNPSHGSELADRSPISMPKVGETRCYWALLSSNLQFLYLDPVLASHLQEQADLLVGKSLLAFVHPDEQASAQQDLGGVLETPVNHAQRLVFLNVLGPAPQWSDGDKIAVDSNYMAVDIVINWAADGVVLCFIHAVVDLTPRDNDEHHKTGWTNWCGTPYMGMHEVKLLHDRLCQAVPQPPSMDRVFQILLNQPDRSLLFSWPTDRYQGQGPLSKDFAKLASEVTIGNAVSNGTDAKTSCTRRFKAQQSMQYTPEGPREVESIFIPYGSVIFACHKVNSYANAKTDSAYAPGTSNQYYANSSYNLPPIPNAANYHGNSYMSQHSSQYPAQSWPGGSDGGSQAQYSQWTSQNTPVSSSPTVSSIRSSSYSTSQQPQSPPQHQWSSQPPPFMEPSPGSQYPFTAGVPYPGTPPVATPGNDAPAPTEDTVPASRVSNRRGSAANRDQYGNGGRSAGNPPVGIMQCASCKVTHSPEWRKGPSGKKDLCNACGLRYARSRAKKEGGTQRRRKDKTLTSMSTKSDHSPSVSPVNVPFNGVRRGSVYEDASFIVGSAGSAASSEIYSTQPTQAGLNGMTPSPSPPSAHGGSFATYPPHPSSEQQNSSSGDHRGHSHYAPQFYSIPPPLPGPTHSMHGGAHSSTTLPRLDPIMPYINPPSYEREKQREKERDRIVLPPTPVSADARSHGGKY